MKIDKSRLFKRAWYLVRKINYTISQALKQVWSEMKKDIKNKLEISAEIKRLSECRGADYQYAGSQLTQTAETMAEYYSSNKYKGD